MARSGSTHVEAQAYVKGGMPVLVEGVYTWDETGADLSDIYVLWYSTGKQVTPKFEKSLSSDDWESIQEALFEAA